MIMHTAKLTTAKDELNRCLAAKNDPSAPAQPPGLVEVCNKNMIAAHEAFNQEKKRGNKINRAKARHKNLKLSPKRLAESAAESLRAAKRHAHSGGEAANGAACGPKPFDPFSS